jgi:hypothetical protein
MSFFRHREIYRSDVIRLVRERHNRRPRPHRLDEFPAGYSSADCSPAESASASPTGYHSALKSSCRSILFHRTANSVLTVCLSPGDHRRIPEVAPELGTYLNTRAREYQMRTSRLPAGTPGVIMTTNVQRPLIEMHLRKTSVRGALNTIAAYTLTHPITDEAGNVLSSPTGWEFRFIVDPDAATGLGGHPQWMPFPVP